MPGDSCDVTELCLRNGEVILFAFPESRAGPSGHHLATGPGVDFLFQSIVVVYVLVPAGVVFYVTTCLLARETTFDQLDRLCWYLQDGGIADFCVSCDTTFFIFRSRFVF